MTEQQLDRIIGAIAAGDRHVSGLVSFSVYAPYLIGVYCDESNEWLYRTELGWTPDAVAMIRHDSVEELKQAVIDQFGYKDDDGDHR